MRCVEFICLSVLMVFFVSACGSDSDPAPLDNLQGNFLIVQFAADNGNSSAALADLTFNGNGTGTYSERGGGGGPFTYTLAADGSINIEGDSGQTDSTYNLLSIVDNDHLGDGYAQVAAGIRKGSGFTDADLVGIFRFVELSTGGPTVDTANIDITFNGFGGATADVDSSDDLADAVGIALTYTMTSSGEFTLTDGPGGDVSLIGQLSNDGSVAIMGTGAGDSMSTLVGIRTSTGNSDASFTGNYSAAQFFFEPANTPPEYTSKLSITSDGAGSISGSFADSDGTTGTIPVGFGYSVIDDGSFEIEMSGATTRETGQLSESGNAFVSSDVVADGDVMTMFGIKKF